MLSLVNLLKKFAFLKDNAGLFDTQNQEKMFWFFREQFRFGHREVLLDFLGLNYSNLILGFLQHGVSPHEKPGYWPVQKLPKSISEFYPVFSWSREAMNSKEQTKYRHVFPIGSPWLYLLSAQGMLSSRSFSSIISSPNARDLLIVPAHGSGHHYAKANYLESIKSLRLRIGEVDASVLLYYTEFGDPSIRQAWISQGFSLECSGFGWGPENRTVWTYNGGRPKFLLNTLKTILNHKEIICLAPTALAIYSASLGIPTSILFNEEISLNLGVADKGKGVERFKEYNSKMELLSNYLLGREYSVREISQEKIDLSRRYLGLESFRTKEELLKLLPIKSFVVPLPS